jgi:hypothetical protein
VTETLTAECLRELLHYDPETGDFTWLAKSRPQSTRVRVGAVAGWIDPPRGYRRITIDRRGYGAARLASLYMTGAWPEAEIDHINGDKADNRWSNLWEATTSQNGANKPMMADNTSGFKGVSRCKRSGKWVSHIRLNGRRKTLGLFDSPERAFIAYIFAAWDYFGDFAQIDADYIRIVRKHKERKALEYSVLWNLARPDPNYMIGEMK